MTDPTAPAGPGPEAAPVPPAPPAPPAAADAPREAEVSVWQEILARYNTDPPSPRRAEMHRIGEALRSIIHRLHGSAAPDDELAAVAHELEQEAARLSAFPTGSLYEGYSEATLAGDPAAIFDHSPMLGRANPLAPPIRVGTHGDRMYGLATFGSGYEGPPGCVHGGYVAAAFDEVLGAAQSLGGRPGMTGRLIVNYRSPTPLNTELRFEGWVDRVEGRKTFTEGTLHAGDRLCAESEGLFVAIDFGKLADLRRQRDAAFGPDAVS
jgi:Thioesterase superfamily